MGRGAGEGTISAVGTRLRSTLTGANRRKSEQGFQEWPPVDVSRNGQQILLPWGETQGYGGNPADLYWVADSGQFIAIHNRYSPDPERGRGAIRGRYKEVYRGNSLDEALKAVSRVATIEGATCRAKKEWLDMQAERINFPLH